jgi:predicted transcriptional regulator
VASSSTVRITRDTSNTLSELAAATGRSKQDVLAAAVDAYSRQLLLDQTNAAYAALRADREGWDGELAERTAWEATLGDGMDDE